MASAIEFSQKSNFKLVSAPLESGRSETQLEIGALSRGNIRCKRRPREPPAVFPVYLNTNLADQLGEYSM